MVSASRASSASAPRARWPAFAGAVVFVFVLAQVGSHLVQAYLPLNEPYVVAPFLHLTHIRNTGVIFGWLPGNSMEFAIAGTAVVIAGCLLLLRTAGSTYQFLCLGLIVGAAASNIVDRLVYGAVIDFIDVRGIPHWHYVFNTADVMIHLGAWPLALGSIFRRD
ncbi:MAG TPA: signal peptidase II [Vicinamibacterales bacterium]|nr:signal peptidase II [Vicinamibacterales bacterium]